MIAKINIIIRDSKRIIKEQNIFLSELNKIKELFPDSSITYNYNNVIQCISVPYSKYYNKAKYCQISYSSMSLYFKRKINNKIYKIYLAKSDSVNLNLFQDNYYSITSLSDFSLLNSKLQRKINLHIIETINQNEFKLRKNIKIPSSLKKLMILS